MTPISNEKRELMIAAKKRGEKEDDIAKWLEISVRSVSRIWKQYSETKSIQPTKPSGRKSSLCETKIEEIRSAVKRQPDLTLEELIDELELPIKKSRLAVILDGMGFSFKKRRYTQKSNYAKIFKKNAPSGLKS
jgi:transposase